MSSEVKITTSHLVGDDFEERKRTHSFPADEGEGGKKSEFTPAFGDVVIRVSNLSKCYQIYDSPRDRLKQFIVPRLQRLGGKTPKQYFREFWALEDVSFEVKRGETIGIIGRNGCGKSTLLQLICGTLSPTNGSVETNGRIAALLELGSGFNPEFSGRDNVYMNGAILGLSKAEIDERYDDIVKFAEIGDFINQPIKTYSSGMIVRLAFAVNIVSRPNTMIVDEALAVGDMNFQAKCMTALNRIQ
jgi:lipopolysaccharide transport system ATP-binding protein